MFLFSFYFEAFLVKQLPAGRGSALSLGFSQFNLDRSSAGQNRFKPSKTKKNRMRLCMSPNETYASLSTNIKEIITVENNQIKGLIGRSIDKMLADPDKRK